VESEEGINTKFAKRENQLMKLSKEGNFRLAVKAAMLAGLAGGAQSAVYAADTTPPAGDQTKGAAKLEAVTVTGTRIKQENLTSTSSLTIISDEELQLQGTVNVETLINNLPQAFAGYSSGDSNGATGTATIDLRGLGAARTLVLIDGKRLMPGDPLQSPPSADVNFIPAALVDSVEVLSGGASAVYGSDAIAGVVNFKMKTDFEGFRLDGQYSQTSHHDAAARDLYAIWGANSASGKGNITLYAGYTGDNALTQDKRKFSSCSITTPNSGKTHKCAGSRTIAEGLFYSYDRAAAGLPYYAIVNPDKTRSFIADDGRTFNFAPYNYFQRPTTRYNFGGFAHNEINEHVDVYGSAMFMQNRSISQVAPSGLFFVNAAIPCNSPFLSADQKQFLCTDVGLADNQFANTQVAKRATEVGPRQDDLRHTDYRVNLGVKGDIIKGVDYDVSVQRGEVLTDVSHLNYINTANAKNALNTLPNGTCASGDPKCVPLDVFQIGAITPAQVNYIAATGQEQATQVEEIVTGAVSADLGRYGVQLPTAKHGLGVAVGAEYRSDTLDYRPDINVQNGNLGGFGGPRPPVSGKISAHELFGEIRLPVLENLPGAKLLALDGAYRRADYSTAGKVNTYKGGLEYKPVEDATLRLSYQRAIRAPSVSEAFSPQALGLFAGSDPCAGANLAGGGPGVPTAAQCANSGVTQAQYDAGVNGTPGAIADCSSGQCNGLFGGNPNLKVEESTTKSIGIVLTPRAVKNLAVTVDYFNIDLKNDIGTIGGAVSLSQCLQTGSPTFCSNIHRGGGGRLSGDSSNANVGFVTDLNTNIGGVHTSGFDTEIAYNLKIKDVGRLSFDYVSTFVRTLAVNTGPGLGTYECAGLYGITCGTPTPRYRHKFRTTLSLPLGLAISADWRHIGATNLDKNQSNSSLQAGKFNFIDNHLVSKNYLDLSGTYKLPLQAQKISLRFGVNNVLDTRPQQVSSNAPNAVSSPPFGNGNTFPNVYDVLGPTFFAGVTADF
jgi:iron complex outermembrane receptor protein